MDAPIPPPDPALLEPITDLHLLEACAQAESWTPTEAAKVTPADRQRFGGSGTDCQDLIRGAQGIYADDSPNWDNARRCCLVQGTCNRELAVLFANGWGTEMDIPAAFHFLCIAQAEMAPAEHNLMLGHLYRKRRGDRPDPLRYCDWISSGPGSAWCESLAFDLAVPRWQALRARVAGRIDNESAALIDPLAAAAETYAKAMSTCVGDLWVGDSAHAGAVRANYHLQLDNFWTLFEELSTERAEESTGADFQAAELELAERLANRLADARRPCDGCPEPSPDVAKNVEAASDAFSHYRNAFAAYYRQRWIGQTPPEVLDRELDTLLMTRAAEDLGALNETD